VASDFLKLRDRTFLVAGVANRKSVAWHVARLLVEAEADVVYLVHSQARRNALADRLPAREVPPRVFVCDVQSDDQLARLRNDIAASGLTLSGLVHSIASADYQAGRRFHETPRQAFLRAIDISCYSLLALAESLKGQLARDASVVTISISTTRMASENYGLMGPVKAALDSSLAFLAKSFSAFSEIRFNAIAPGLLKTSSSAGIPGYVDSYLFAEQATLRKRAVETEEAAAAAVFLLSPRSSGINAQKIVVDAGMCVNYFDPEIVARVVR
jgi:enoyl-[acyl-carrier protein] reductase I